MILYRLSGSTTMLSSRNPVDAAHPRATTLFSYAYYASKPIICHNINRYNHDNNNMNNNGTNIDNYCRLPWQFLSLTVNENFTFRDNSWQCLYYNNFLAPQSTLSIVLYQLCHDNSKISMDIQHAILIITSNRTTFNSLKSHYLSARRSLDAIQGFVVK